VAKEKIILSAIVGSHAYGLANEDSDIDTLGIYVAPTQEVLGIRNIKETIHKTNPDVTYHEVKKFISLALKCNPTILELLFVDKYLKQTPEGLLLVHNRKAFLSRIIYNSYGGYAISQARKLNAKGTFPSKVKNRYAKHARHVYRLLDQGRQLLETGNLNVKVKNRDELMRIGELPVYELITKFEKDFKKFDQTVTTLPDKPDYETINKILLEIRSYN